MNIGEFKNINGQLLGGIATAAMNLPRLGLRPIVSDHAKAPKYEVVTLNGRMWVQIGAVWEAKSNSTGEFFLQGSIDDPSFVASLSIACFGNAEDGYRLAWTRKRRRANRFAQSDGMGMGEGENQAREGDGFTGNATEDGTLIPGEEQGDGGSQTGSSRYKASERLEEPIPAFS